MDFDLSKIGNHQTYNLLCGLVAPRPIAWITSHDHEGRLNAAPFSAYNYVCTDPPVVAIGVANRPAKDIIGKDTAQNIRNTHEFVINVVNEEVTTLWKSKDEKGGPELYNYEGSTLMLRHAALRSIIEKSLRFTLVVSCR